MSHVRRATESDAPAIARMGAAFLERSGHAALFAPAAGDLEARARAMLADPWCAVFVADRDGEPQAMLVAALVGAWFAPSRVFATELAWWVDPEARGTTVAVRLVRAYEEWARESGAIAATMSSLERCDGEIVGTMLARMGYARGETTHYKEL